MSVKRITINEAWKYCRTMWIWIAKQFVEQGGLAHLARYQTTDLVEKLKVEWLETHKMSGAHNNCLFCTSAKKRSRTSGICPKCPGKMVDPNFDCTAFGKAYDDNPVEFKNEILRLSRLRNKH